MKSFLYILLVSILVSCQIEDDGAPSPDETYIKYFGELTNYEASDIEIVYDATGTIPEGLVVFGSKLSDRGDKDFFVLRADLEGNLIDSVSFGLTDTLDIDGDGIGEDWEGDENADTFYADDVAGQIQFVSDFGDGSSGYAIVGTSSITINALGVSEWQNLTFGFLNADLTFRSFQNRSLVALRDISQDELLDFVGNDIIVLSSGDFLIAGGREIDRGGGDSDFDNYFLGVNFQNGIVFEDSRGIIGDDEEDILVRAFEKENGNLVMIGNSNTASFRGENGGLNGVNVFYFETDENGTPVNSRAYGIEDTRAGVESKVYNDVVSDVIKSSIGYSVVGTSTTDDNEQYAFIMQLSNNGIYLTGSAHHFSTFNPDGTTLQSLGEGVTEGLDNNLIMLGQFTSFNTGDFSRGGEGMFVKYSQGSTPIAGAESFFGLADGNDKVVDAVTLPDGKIAAVANVDFGGGVTLMSIIKLNANGSLD